jgi:TnpA family transposase
MPRRHILTERQRKALFDLPADEGALLRHYTLDDDDIEHIRTRRHAHNKLGFALQLCAFRYPGRLLTAGEVIPLPVTEFLAAQIGVKPHELAGYAETEVTRRRHLIDLRSLYGHKMFSGRGTRDLKVWLEGEAETALSNEDLVKRFMVECQRTQTILPSISTIERLCTDALVAAERRIETRIVNCLNNVIKDQLDALLAEQVDGRISRFIWLRQFEVGKNSACINRLLDRLEFLQGIKLPVDVLKGVPPHRIIRLRRQGERYFTDGLRDISSDRRLAILAVCAVEWRTAIADAIVETHDRIVGKTWRDASRLCDVQIKDAKTSLQETLRSFKNLGAALLEAKEDDAPLDPAVATACGWNNLEGLVATAARLGDTMSAEPLAHVVQGYHRFRRYAPRMLQALDIKAASVAEPLMAAANIIKENKGVADKPITFLRRNPKWLRHLKDQNPDNHRLWEVAVGSGCNVPFARCLPIRRYLVSPFPALRRSEAGFGVDRSGESHTPPNCSVLSCRMVE